MNITSCIKKLSIVLLVAVNCIYADVIVTRGTETNGIFVNFAQFKVYFQKWDSNTVNVYDPVKIDKLEFDEPISVQLTLVGSPRNQKDAVLKGFDKTRFLLQVDGQEKHIHYRQILRLDNTIDEKDFIKRRSNALEGKTGEEAKFRTVTELLEEGKATIIHFHVEGVDISEEHGNILKKLCNDTGGTAVYKRITVTGPSDPVYKKYKFASLPQFWFFSSKGAVIAKLSDDYTEEGLKESFQRARRGK